MLVGTVDDGTHCNQDKGVCVLGVCQPMPKYVAPTEPPPTDSSGKYQKTPVSCCGTETLILMLFLQSLQNQLVCKIYF